MIRSAIRRAALPLLLLSLGAPGCGAVTAQARSETRLRARLDEHRIHRPLREVWPLARLLVVERGFQLAGRDRAAAGQPPEGLGFVKQITRGGFETRPDGKGGATLETRENRDRLRYRVEGLDAGEGTCRVRFVAVRRTGSSPSEERSRDLDLEVELLRRLEPEEARRIAGAGDCDITPRP